MTAQRQCCDCDRPATWPPRAPVHCCWLCYDRIEQGGAPEHTPDCGNAITLEDLADAEADERERAVHRRAFDLRDWRPRATDEPEPKQPKRQEP